jgi:hypothetical protein
MTGLIALTVGMELTLTVSKNARARAKDIARSLAYGDITEVETRSMVAEIAAVTAARLQSEGKSVSPDVLAERLFEAIKEASVKSVAELRARMFERIVKSRMKVRERRETLGIL